MTGSTPGLKIGEFEETGCKCTSKACVNRSICWMHIFGAKPTLLPDVSPYINLKKGYPTAVAGLVCHSYKEDPDAARAAAEAEARNRDRASIYDPAARKDDVGQGGAPQGGTGGQAK